MLLNHHIVLYATWLWGTVTIYVQRNDRTAPGRILTASRRHRRSSRRNSKPTERLSVCQVLSRIRLRWLCYRPLPFELDLGHTLDLAVACMNGSYYGCIDASAYLLALRHPKRPLCSRRGHSRPSLRVLALPPAFGNTALQQSMICIVLRGLLAPTLLLLALIRNWFKSASRRVLLLRGAAAASVPADKLRNNSVRAAALQREAAELRCHSCQPFLPIRSGYWLCGGRHDVRRKSSGRVEQWRQTTNETAATSCRASADALTARAAALEAENEALVMIPNTAYRARMGSLRMCDRPLPCQSHERLV